MHLTNLWSETCHRGIKNITDPYTNFSKKYTRPYTNFSKSIPDLSFLYQKLEIGTVPYTEIVKVHTPYRSLCRYLENRYISLWHVLVPKIHVVHPSGFDLKPILHQMEVRTKVTKLPYNFREEKNEGKFSYACCERHHTIGAKLYEIYLYTFVAALLLFC